MAVTVLAGSSVSGSAGRAQLSSPPNRPGWPATGRVTTARGEGEGEASGEAEALEAAGACGGRAGGGLAAGGLGAGAGPQAPASPSTAMQASDRRKARREATTST